MCLLFVRSLLTYLLDKPPADQQPGHSFDLVKEWGYKSHSPPEYSPCGEPSYYSVWNATLKAHVGHLNQFLILTNCEKRDFASKHCVGGKGEGFTLRSSADLGNQAFASLTIHFFLESNTPSSGLPLEELRSRTLAVFLDLHPTVTKALSGVACVLGILPPNLESDRLFLHLLKVKDMSMDMFGIDVTKQPVVSVLDHSGPFSAVHDELNKPLTSKVIGYVGCLTCDLQSAIVSNFRDCLLRFADHFRNARWILPNHHRVTVRQKLLNSCRASVLCSFC